MRDETRMTVAFYRLQRAQETLDEAKTLMAAAKFKGSASRAYYAIFHATRAVLATEGQDFKKHSAVIAYFRQHYIKTGIFDNKYSDLLGDLFSARQKSDYDDFYIVSKAEVTEWLASASDYITSVDLFLHENAKK